MADDGTTRSQFLTLSTVGMGAAIGAVIGVPVTAYMLAPVDEEVKFEPVFLGKADAFPADPSFKPTAATYVEDPQNAATSPGLAFVQNTGKSNTDWLAQDAMFIVFSNRCMHLGCPVAVAQGVGFACPCHGGQYDKEGRRTAGPPIRPLDRFQWEIKNFGRALDHPALVGVVHRRPAHVLPGQDARPAGRASGAEPRRRRSVSERHL